MDCEDKKKSFEDAFSIIAAELKDSLAQVSANAQSQAQELANAGDDSNDVSEGVGMAAGAAIGGYVGGPAGAAVGATIGQTLGKLFDIEFSSREERISFDVPRVTMKNREVSLDVPSVTVSDEKISFDSIEVVMERRRGPDIPKSKCWMDGLVPKCKVWTEPSYFDVPVTRSKRVEIILGVPQVSMRRQEFSLNVPEFSMATQEVVFNVPTVKITSKKDIAEKLSKQAAELVTQTEADVEARRDRVRTKIKVEVIPKATDMFTCFTESIVEQRKVASAQFDAGVVSLNEALKALKVKKVPDDDDDVLRVRKQLDDLVKSRDEALATFDEALKTLDVEMKKSLADIENL